MNIAPGSGRHFLFLQGPHGPFFRQLGRSLLATGAQVTRIGFNAGDQFFWRDRSSYVAFRKPLADWPEFLEHILDLHQITDIVLYGEPRPVHARAIEIARRRAITTHLFEEGYLRPWWVSYERAGTNGNSRLMEISLAQMRARLSAMPERTAPAPDHWGDMRQHMFYGALYHWFVWFANGSYRHFEPHREIPVSREFSLYLKRFLLSPLHAARRIRATRAIKRAGFPYHLVLLQLAHDASFLAHSPFADMASFLAEVIEGFAAGAPQHHHLVFKTHPLDDGREPLRATINRLVHQHGLQGRVHLLPGGKLARLLDGARSAVTVNSTAAQQALWRGLPVLAFGTAVYSRPELVSPPPAAEFFRAPSPPDADAYHDFRRFLLATSQVAGGFYAARSRQQLLRNVVDMILDPRDPYDALQPPTAAKAQQLHVVK